MVAGQPVLSAVGFDDDDQTRLYTGKVDNIRRYRMLPPEPPAELVVAKLCPEHPLCVRRVPAQTASAPNDRRATTHVPTAPLSREILPYPPCRRKTSQAPP
jgi:hypothetical protein